MQEKNVTQIIKIGLCAQIDPMQQRYSHLVYDILDLYNRRFSKLSNDTKFVKIEVILLKVQLLQSVYFLLFYLYFTHYFA